MYGHLILKQPSSTEDGLQLQMIKGQFIWKSIMYIKYLWETKHLLLALTMVIYIHRSLFSKRAYHDLVHQ